MAGLPGIPAYADNPARCYPLSVISENQTKLLKSKGIQVPDEIEISNHMLSKVEITTHIGTHIDAPSHMLEDTLSIDEVPLESIVKKGKIIPLTDIEPGGMVTADAILKSGVDFDETVIPILHTRWTEKTWGTSEFWNNTVFMHKDAAELVAERNVSAVAIDFFPEFPFWREDVERPEGQPPGHNHKIFLAQETIIIQMVTNVGAIDDEDFILCAVPLRLEGLDGSPARVFAMIQ
jgi:kynurenine formamidase